MSTPEDPRMNAELSHVHLPRLETGYVVSPSRNFTVGILSATLVCAVGYAMYVWFFAG